MTKRSKPTTGRPGRSDGPPLVDEPARVLIRTHLDETLVVEAAAGTGKTTELVQRIVNVIADQRARIDQIVAVTFTEKAAGELKLRLRSELEIARQDVSAGATRRASLEHAVAHLEEAHIGTIHGFCADMLRERPVEAGIDPGFEVLPEDQAERLYARAFDLWLQQTLEDPPEGVRRSLRRISSFGDDAGPTDRLCRAGWTLTTWRDFPAPWRREPFDRDAEVDRLVQQLHEFADAEATCTNTRDGFFRDTWRARQLSDAARTATLVRARDYDALEGRLIALVQNRDFRIPGRKGYPSNWRGAISRAEVHDLHQRLVDELERFVRVADADLAACLRDELAETIDRYEALKARTGALDFVDLLVRARDLVRDHDAVRTDFQRRFTHLFVDEFQDTDPLQAEIVLLLAADDPAVRDWRRVRPVPGKLFIVGDPKQSIYRFRRADVGIYQEVKAQLSSRGATEVTLTTSFRAVPTIQRAVNAAFASVMTGDAGTLQAGYVPLSPFREDAASQPSVVALSVPRPYGKRRVAQYAVEASLPDAVGAFVDWLIRTSNWTVTEREQRETRVALAPRHVCLLFRRFEKFGTDMTRDYVEALEARGIPHLLVGGKSFHAREEVETLRAALAAIEWPDEELSVFATLHGSLFAAGDEALLEYRDAYGRLHPYRVPEPLPAHLAHIGEALTLLRSLHRQRNYVPVTETVGRLLDATRAHAGFVLRPSGEQTLANVLQVAELARQYELTGGISFRGFVEKLNVDAEAGEAAEAPILEDGSDGVRIMTVHRAKGLEFPVVILADTTANLAHQQASRYIDAEHGLCAARIAGWSPVDLLDHQDVEVERDRAEGVRIAYVAATRARDLLVVPGIGDGPLDGRWTSPLDEAIYPPMAGRRSPQNAPGCPPFGKDSVLERPDGDPAMDATVAPGLHQFGSRPEATDAASNAGEAYGVVWWDPSTLTLDAPPPFGLRQHELIGKDVGDEVVRADLEVYAAWKARRTANVEQGSRPSLVVQTVTGRATAGDEAEADEVSVVEVGREEGRPGGVRFGALVHEVLAVAPLDGNRNQVVDVARVRARMLGATGEEAKSAAAVVSAALGHDLMARAREASARGACRRETPVTYTDADGQLVEGVVDLAFLEGETWTVVDFKTDRELTAALEVYKRQVKLYADIVSTATGQTARPILMRI